jgi:hypothetical protein
MTEFQCEPGFHDQQGHPRQMKSWAATCGCRVCLRGLTAQSFHARRGLGIGARYLRASLAWRSPTVPASARTSTTPCA